MSSMGTNVKPNIFGTYPATSANVNRNTFHNIFLSMTASANIIIYFYSKIRINCGRSCIVDENPYHFHNNKQFCIFAHLTKSSFCNVFLTNKAFVTFHDIDNNEIQAKTEFHYY